MLRTRIQSNISTSTPHQRPSRNSLSFPIYTDQMREADDRRKQEQKTCTATPMKVRRDVKNLVNGIRKESERTIRL